MSEGDMMLVEGEGVIARFEAVELLFEHELQKHGSLGAGDLLVTTKRILWTSGSNSKQIAFDFSDVVLHALNRGGERLEQSSDDRLAIFDRPCIYVQMEWSMRRVHGLFATVLVINNNSDAWESPPETDMDDTTTLNLFFAPSILSNSTLDMMFKSFSEGLMMNPDGTDESEQEGESDVFMGHASSSHAF